MLSRAIMIFAALLSLGNEGRDLLKREEEVEKRENQMRSCS